MVVSLARGEALCPPFVGSRSAVTAYRKNANGDSSRSRNPRDTMSTNGNVEQGIKPGAGNVWLDVVARTESNRVLLLGTYCLCSVCSLRLPLHWKP